jgi:hypothetical protein
VLCAILAFYGVLQALYLRFDLAQIRLNEMLGYSMVDRGSCLR